MTPALLCLLPVWSPSPLKSPSYHSSLGCIATWVPAWVSLLSASIQSSHHSQARLTLIKHNKSHHIFSCLRGFPEPTGRGHALALAFQDVWVLPPHSLLPCSTRHLDSDPSLPLPVSRASVPAGPLPGQRSPSQDSEPRTAEGSRAAVPRVGSLSAGL